MHNKLFTTYHECINMVRACGIDTGDIIDVSVNYRLTRALGRCIRDNRSGTYRIEIQSGLLADNVDIQALRDTMTHEILHTCYGALNHGPEWQRLARVVMDAHPEYTVTRLTNPTRYGYTAPEALTLYRHKYTCIECGAYWYRKRALKGGHERYHCSCGGRLEDHGIRMTANEISKEVKAC